MCHFHAEGKIDVVIERLMICWMAGAKASAPSLTVLVSIKSIPVALEFLRPLINLITSSRERCYILNLQDLFLMADLKY